MKKVSQDIYQFIEAVVFVPSSMVDAVSSYVTDNIAPGVELNDTEKPFLVGVKFYVPALDKKNFRPAFNKYLSQIVSKEMPEAPKIQENRIVSKDWEDSYRDSIQPVLIDNDICVRPPWSKAPRGTEFDIIIEPKMAFGTGHHETTRTCLHLIHSRFKRGQRLLDFGCGSGVLAILADKMGQFLPYLIFARGHNGCMRNLQAQGVAKQGGHGKPVRNSPDHGRLSRGPHKANPEVALLKDQRRYINQESADQPRGRQQFHFIEFTLFE